MRFKITSALLCVIFTLLLITPVGIIDAATPSAKTHPSVVGDISSDDVVCSVTATPSSGQTPLAVTLTATCASSSSKIVAYTWDCGNGTLPQLPWGSVVVCSYPNPGTFYPIVAAVDALGNGNSASTTETATNSTICGPPDYCAYVGTDIVVPGLPPNLGTYTKNNAIVYDTSYSTHANPPSKIGRIGRCTDENAISKNGLGGFSAGQGGATSAIMVNAGSPPTLAHIVVSTGGSGIVLFNATTMDCSAAITNAQNQTIKATASNANNYAQFGTGQFDLKNPSTWFSFGIINGISASTATSVTPYTINTTTGNFTIGNPIAYLSNFLPIGSNVHPWQPNTKYYFGQYVSYTLTPGQYLTWAPNTTFKAGDLIWPSPPGGCAFVAEENGITGTTEPTWPYAGTCEDNATKVTDNTMTWHSIVGGASFIYQVTAPINGGTSGSSQAFCSVECHPDIMSLVTDNDITWTNTSVNTVNPVWGSLTNVGPNGANITKGYSTNTYGAASTSPESEMGLCTYANCTGDQGTGQFVTAYDTVHNVGQLFNTITDIQSSITCVGGSGPSCSGGAWQWSFYGQVNSIPCPFFLHDSSSSLDAKISVMSVQSGFIGSNCPSTSPSVWNPYQTPFNAATQAFKAISPITHAAYGYTHLSGIAASKALYGYYLGPYALTPAYASMASVYPISWQAVPCLTYPDSWVPGDEELACFPQFDDHLSWANNPGDDSTPVCGGFYGVLADDVNFIPASAYWGEVVCYTTSPTWTNPATPNSAQKQYRFAHLWDFQTNINFNIQFAICELSQDGKFLFCGTDWQGGFGSTTGLAPTLPIPEPNVLCAGGFPVNPSTAYSLGTLLTPIANLNGSGTIYDTYQVTVAGTSHTTTAPTYSSNGAVGTVVLDGTMQLTDIGRGTCRGEVVVFELL